MSHHRAKFRPMTKTSSQIAVNPEGQRQRDLRLDFFRGMAMFIILLAHTPANGWTLWIPARFGFSDATEIFVFCSGMASGIAFGAVFLKKSWFLGAARIAFRVWQVYWAHIGVVMATGLLMVIVNETGIGAPDKDYTQWFPVGGFFSTVEGRPEQTLLGLFTLTYIPGLFDILPMYLVILAMVPFVMAVHWAAGRPGVFVFVGLIWLAANMAGYARLIDRHQDLYDLAEAAKLLAGMLPVLDVSASADALIRENIVAPWQDAIAALGRPLLWMNLPGIPWEPDATWFFNPFAWQLVFFTGFAFAVGWLPAPPVRRWLIWTAVAVVLITLPFAWHKMYQYYTGYIPENAVGRFFWNARETIEPVRWKTWVGAWRFVHFLAVAYLAWVAVGAAGERLRTGWQVIPRARRTRFKVRAATGLVLILTAPYTYIEEIRLLAPALDAWLVANIPLIDGRYHGLLHILHLGALIAFLWHAIGDRARVWLVRDAFLAVVPVIRKVGTQSLAVFLVSILMARFNGAWKDGLAHWAESQAWTYFNGRDVWAFLLVNATGFAVLIATAYIAAWFKKQPWRDRAPAAHSAPRRNPSDRTRPVPAE